MNDLAESLTTSEADLLAISEQTIERGIKTFIETGNALADIRDNRLYRVGFATFATYCEQRWSLGESRAYQLIDSAAVAELISSTTVEKIHNEAQARELAPLLDDPEELVEVFNETVARTDGKPTAAAIREVRRDRDPAERAYPTPPPAQGPPKTVDRPMSYPRPTPVNPPPVPPDHVSAEEAAEIVDRVNRHLPHSPELAYAEFRGAFFDAVKNTGKVLRFDDADVAEKADDQAIEEFARVIRNLRDKYDRIVALRDAPKVRRLKVVNGNG